MKWPRCWRFPKGHLQGHAYMVVVMGHQPFPFIVAFLFCCCVASSTRSYGNIEPKPMSSTNRAYSVSWESLLKTHLATKLLNNFGGVRERKKLGI